MEKEVIDFIPWPAQRSEKLNHKKSHSSRKASKQRKENSTLDQSTNTEISPVLSFDQQGIGQILRQNP
jgi:hypothetical protein